MERTILTSGAAAGLDLGHHALSSVDVGLGCGADGIARSGQGGGGEEGDDGDGELHFDCCFWW